MKGDERVYRDNRDGGPDEPAKVKKNSAKAEQGNGARRCASPP